MEGSAASCAGATPGPELRGKRLAAPSRASKPIHPPPPQVILTYGMSDTVLLFLKEASKKREFQVGRGAMRKCYGCKACMPLGNTPDDMFGIGMRVCRVCRAQVGGRWR